MSQTQTESTQITPLDVLVSGIYKAQSRGAYNLNEAAILAKAVQHFGQRQMINPVIMKQISGQGEQNLNIKEEVKEEMPSPPPPPSEATTPIPPPVLKNAPPQESKPQVSITDDDLSEVYVIGGNKNKANKSNLRMVIEDDED